MTDQSSSVSNHLAADYLVIGAGAMGMAFVDEILSGDFTATVVLVDRYAGPGGHWRRSYPFVSLHQPAAFYGVNSENLGSGGKSVASGLEVVAYFQRVLERHVASGRLKFFPHCEYLFGPRRFKTKEGEKKVADSLGPPQATGWRHRENARHIVSFAVRWGRVVAHRDFGQRG